MKNKLKIKTENIFNKVVASSILFFILFFSIKVCAQYLNISQKAETTTLKEKEGKYLAANVSDDMCKYLSDIEYIKEDSKVGWGSITLDSNLETKYNHGLITLLIDGEKTYFLKGISAHANSTLVYDIEKAGSFDKFSTYVGVDESRGSQGNGVKFKIYTSNDKENWTLKTSENPNALKGDKNAEKLTIDVTGAKYLKLECDCIGSNSSDHAVYANPILYKNGYEESTMENADFIKTVEEYDNELKDKTLEQQINDYEQTLLQRTFVNSVGYDLLQAIVKQDEQYKETVKWLMTDLPTLRLYVLGGEPDGGSYYNSIKELTRLYNAYKTDFENNEKTNNPWEPNLTKGDVYRKMAISLSLTHATKVGYWAQIDHPANRSDSVNRYAKDTRK